MRERTCAQVTSTNCMVSSNTWKLREHHSFQRIIGTILPTFLIKSLSQEKKGAKRWEMDNNHMQTLTPHLNNTRKRKKKSCFQSSTATSHIRRTSKAAMPRCLMQELRLKKQNISRNLVSPNPTPTKL